MKTIEDLRGVLCDQIDKLSSGKGDTKQANSISCSIGKILSSAKLEMEYAKSHGKVATISFMKLSNTPKSTLKAARKAMKK